MDAAAENIIPGELFGAAAAGPRDGRSLSKKAFAERLGLTQGRVSQLVKRGLPVLVSGRIDWEMGRRWYVENTDASRRKGGTAADPETIDDDDVPTGSRARHDHAKAEMAILLLAEKRGEVIDRGEAERTVFGRARAERDAWIGWVSRAAAAVAAEAGADLPLAAIVIDRLVREQLDTLATTTLQDLTR